MIRSPSTAPWSLATSCSPGQCCWRSGLRHLHHGWVHDSGRALQSTTTAACWQSSRATATKIVLNHLRRPRVRLRKRLQQRVPLPGRQPVHPANCTSPGDTVTIDQTTITATSLSSERRPYSALVDPMIFAPYPGRQSPDEGPGLGNNVVNIGTGRQRPGPRSTWARRRSSTRAARQHGQSRWRRCRLRD